MKLSIIIPVYNEENTILRIIKAVEEVDIGNIEKDIIIIDDCSTDNTRNILKNLENHHKILYHPKNKGKGAAIRTGLKYVDGDIILIQDADLEYNPKDYPKLLEPILKGEAKVVYGSRFLNKKYKIIGKNRIIMAHHLIGNKFLSLVISLLYSSKITDMETCYKVIKREIIKNIKLRANGFDIEPEITTKILKKGYTIKEVQIEFKARDFNQGKKITWKDGVKALFCLLKWRFLD
jgi:glycosyltransferase involved in cell wall biosynthesis